MGNCASIQKPPPHEFPSTPSTTRSKQGLSSSPSPSKSDQRIETVRKDGQALLRSMVQDKDVDWNKVIQTAYALHAEEQELLKSQKKEQRMKFHKKALQKRLKFDSSGSFSANMLTYKIEDVDDQVDDLRDFDNMNHTKRISSSPTISTLSSGNIDDHSSFGSSNSATSNSFGFCRSPGSGIMSVIPEGNEFQTDFQ